RRRRHADARLRRGASDRARRRPRGDQDARAGHPHQHFRRGGRMKHARVMVNGMVLNATERDGQVVLEDGRRLWQDQVTWLPPLPTVDKPRTILALGLNYVDRAKKLEFKPPEEPLVFLKGERAL